MIDDSRRILKMVILETPYDIHSNTAVRLIDGSLPQGGHQGVMTCREAERADAHAGEAVGNSAYPNNTNFKWLVLVPKYLSQTSGVTGNGIPFNEPVSPPYIVGETIYCIKLDVPVALSAGSIAGLNRHPSIDVPDGGGLLLSDGWSDVQPNNASLLHFGGGMALSTIYWLDLNVDGRTRTPVSSSSAEGSEGGIAQNVWL